MSNNDARKTKEGEGTTRDFTNINSRPQRVEMQGQANANQGLSNATIQNEQRLHLLGQGDDDDLNRGVRGDYAAET